MNQTGQKLDPLKRLAAKLQATAIPSDVAASQEPTTQKSTGGESVKSKPVNSKQAKTKTKNHGKAKSHPEVKHQYDSFAIQKAGH